MKIFVCLVLISLATGVSSTCSVDGVQKCLKQLLAKITEGSTGCSLMESYISCVRPVITTCDSKVKNDIQERLDKFNKQFDCNVRLSGHAVTATFVTVILAAIFATRFN